MAKANTKIGDVFSVKMNENSKKYFQYIISDLTQLNSDVIRVFKEEYPVSAKPDLLEIVNGEIDFYAHCITKLGAKMGYWEPAGNITEIGSFKDVLFKSSSDDGNPEIKVSRNWWVWKINENQKHVGKLEGENRKAEVGSVIPPDSIVHRMRTGKYDFVYPEFE